MRHPRQLKRTRNTSRQPSGSKQLCGMLLFITLPWFDQVYTSLSCVIGVSLLYTFELDPADWVPDRPLASRFRFLMVLWLAARSSFARQEGIGFRLDFQYHCFEMLLCLVVHATAILWARQAFQTATVRVIRTTGMCSV